MLFADFGSVSIRSPQVPSSDCVTASMIAVGDASGSASVAASIGIRATSTSARYLIGGAALSSSHSSGNESDGSAPSSAPLPFVGSDATDIKSAMPALPHPLKTGPRAPSPPRGNYSGFPARR